MISITGRDDANKFFQNNSTSSSIGSHINACKATDLAIILLLENFSIIFEPKSCESGPNNPENELKNPIWALFALSARAKGVMYVSPIAPMTEVALPSLMERRSEE